MKRGIVAVGVVLVCATRTFALNPALDVSQYAHKAWIYREGLAPGQVTSMAQTRDGYLWLGTEFGLLRFNGVRTVPWHPPGNQRLPNSWIRALLVTPDGTLWIGTLEGLASWADGKLTEYPELAGHAINTLLSDREGTVWAGTYRTGAGRRRAATGALCAIRQGRAECDSESFGVQVGALYEDTSGTLWVAASNGLWRVQSGVRKHYPATMSGILSLQRSEPGAGGLLIADETGMKQLVGENVVPYSLPGGRFEFKPARMLRDRDGSLWIGTLDRGLLHVHQGRTDTYTQANGLSGDFVTRLFQDQEGNIWVATKHGLDRFRDLAITTISANQGLSSAAPWSVLTARDGSVWLGALDGLSRWRASEITMYRPRGDLSQPRDAVGNLFEDREGRLWVSTYGGVAYLEKGRFIRVGHLPVGAISSIGADSAGDLWIAYEVHGLFRLHGTTVVDEIPWARLKLEPPATVMVPDLSHGGFWLGSQGRVAYVKDGAIRASFTVADGLADGRVNDLRLDRTGALWVAMESGLSHLKGGRVVTLSSRNGLPCAGVHWTMEDDEHSVWLYMPCGLVRVALTEFNAAVGDPTRTLETAVFDSSDGVGLRVRPALYSPAVARSGRGELWFLSGSGVSLVNPRRLSLNTIPPPVQIEQLTADRKTYDAVSGLRLPPLVRDLEIDYTALSFVAPEKNQFRVKLEGRDRDWQDAGTRRQAFYADLPPRTYRFRVTASNNNGVWNETGAVLEFSIAPAYYQRTSFRVAAVVIIVVLVWGWYRLHLRRLAHDFSLRLDERVNERTRIARELHDTLLQSFQGSVLRIQSARDMLPDHPEKAVVALDGALDRADQAIVEGRDAIQSLRSSTIVSNELAEALTALARELACGDAGRSAPTFRISVDGAPRDLHPIVRDDIHRIADEALRNAFRHAAANHVEAELTYGPRELRVRIRDDGKGIDPEHLRSGRARHWGLTGMRERALQIGGHLYLWSHAGAGTELELAIPGAVAYATRAPRSVFRLRRTRKGVS